MTKIHQKINFYFLLALIIFIPLQAFCVAFLASNTTLTSSDIFWLSHWYEPILIILFAINLFLFLKNRPKINFAISIYGLILFFTTISIVFFSSSIGRGIEGFRFSLISLLVLPIALMADLNGKDKQKVISTYLFLAITITFLAIIERFLPSYYWQNIGFLNRESNFGFGFFNAGKLIQSSSIIGAPNQLASYLLPAFFLLVYKIKELKLKPIGSYFSLLALTMLVALAIFFTFSRSALVGLAAGLFVALFFFIKSNKIKVIAILSLVIISCLLFLVVKSNPNLNDFLTHTNQTGHADSLRATLNELQDRYNTNKTSLLFGSGLGSAGPTAIKYNNGIVSESWYLQIALEFGIIGLTFWLMFVFVLLKNLYLNNKAVFLGLMAVSFTALFLHTLADNPALSFTLMTIIGVSLKIPEKE